MAHRFVLVVVTITLILSGVGYYLFANGYFGTSSAQGSITMKGCFYDPNGQVLGCNASTRVLGQDVTNLAGQKVGSIGIAQALAKVNYTGTISSWSLAASEKIDYQTAISESFPISMQGTGAPPKSFNLTLPGTLWTVSQLQGKWTSYGTKLVNVSVVNAAITATFSNGQKLTKVSAYNYVAQFALVYSAPPITTTTSASRSSSTYPTSTTAISTTVTTSITSTSTTVNSITITTGKIDTWVSTVTAATGGLTGNQASNGVIITIAPDASNPSQAITWVYLPASLPSANYFINLVTKGVSIGSTAASLSSSSWHQFLFSVSLSAGDLVIVSVTPQVSNTAIFNQALTVSAAVSANNNLNPTGCNFPQAGGVLQSSQCHGINTPPSPYDTPFFAWNNVVTPQSPYFLSNPSSATYTCKDSNSVPFYSTSVSCTIPQPVTVTTSTISTTVTLPSGACAGGTGVYPNCITTTTSNIAVVIVSGSSTSTVVPLCWGTDRYGNPIAGYSGKQCIALSVVSVTF